MKTKYLDFRFVEQLPKTKVWEVCSNVSYIRLGLIKWFGKWRQYAFFPEQGTVFNHQCLEDIYEFIKYENEIRKPNPQ